MRLIELDPALVGVDDACFPDRDTTFVFEHLRYYCSLFEPLPAIGIEVRADSVVVVRGHEYLRVARSLGRRRVRAVVAASSAPDAVAGLVARQDVHELSWPEIDAEERAAPTAAQWHVYYFTRPLDDAEKQRFSADVIGFLLGLDGTGPAPVRSVEFDDLEARVRFQAVVPVGDERWYDGYRAAATAFSDHVVAIRSFQGRRFPA